MATNQPTEKRPRGRPPTGRATKRTKTFTLAEDVCAYLATTSNQSEAIEQAIKNTKGFAVFARSIKAAPVPAPVQVARTPTKSRK